MDNASHLFLGTNSITPLFPLVHRLEHAADRCFFAPHGLSLSTGRILMCLYGMKKGETLTELTRIMGGKKSNMTQRIASLKKMGFVEVIESSLSDRRSINIVLTPEGKCLAQKMEEIFGEHITKLEQAMTYDQRKQLCAIVEILQKQLDDLECLHV